MVEASEAWYVFHLAHLLRESCGLNCVVQRIPNNVAYVSGKIRCPHTSTEIAQFFRPRPNDVRTRQFHISCPELKCKGG